MLCTNYFKVTPFSGSPKKSVLSRRGLPSSSGSKRDLGDNNLSQQYLDDEGNFSPPPWSTAMFHHALFPYFSTCFIISTGASPVRPHCTTDHHGQAMFFAINWHCSLFFHDDDKDAFAILQLWQRWLRRWYESRSFYQEFKSVSAYICLCYFFREF